MTNCENDRGGVKKSLNSRDVIYGLPLTDTFGSSLFVYLNFKTFKISQLPIRFMVEHLYSFRLDHGGDEQEPGRRALE